jgi:hypothetical protein
VSRADWEATRRARHLLLWYPKEWRAQYGDEFAELLVADISERPRSSGRTIDVVRGGLVARTAAAGLGGGTLEPSEQVRRSLVTQGCAMALFLVFGLSIWAQLTIGWQWSEPNAAATSAGMILMSFAVLAFVALAVLAAVPIASAVIRQATTRTGRPLVMPALLFLSGLIVMIVGSRHFENGWPGTGAHPWTHQRLVPGGLAAFTWASTLGVSSYWSHPLALLAFPKSEIAWMVVSLIATASLVTGAAKTLRRLDVSPRTLRYETRLARIGTFALILFLAGACSWVFDGGPGPRNLFHVGLIDVLAVAVMAATLVLASRASQQAVGRLSISPH